MNRPTDDKREGGGPVPPPPVIAKKTEKKDNRFISGRIDATFITLSPSFTTEEKTLQGMVKFTKPGLVAQFKPIPGENKDFWLFDADELARTAGASGGTKLSGDDIAELVRGLPAFKRGEMTFDARTRTYKVKGIVPYAEYAQMLVERQERNSFEAGREAAWAARRGKAGRAAANAESA